MAVNITVRLPWHMDGWNGAVCRDPKGNTYCSGRFSYPGDAIATTKNEGYEVGCAGKHCGKLVAYEPISSLYYAEHDKDVFTFCSARCLTIAAHNANKDPNNEK